jgi:hypothetical protein
VGEVSEANMKLEDLGWLVEDITENGYMQGKWEITIWDFYGPNWWDALFGTKENRFIIGEWKGW